MRPEHWLYTIPLRLRSLFRRRQVDQELEDELRDHVERKTEEYVGKGLAPEEARRHRSDLTPRSSQFSTPMFFDRFRFEIQTVSIDSHGPIDVQQDTPSRGQNSRPFRIAISRSPRPRASSLYLRVLTVIRFWAN